MKKYQNQADAEKLEIICNQFKIIDPSEGRFQDCLIDDMISSIKNLGSEKIFFGDDWGGKQEPILTSELELNNNEPENLLDFIPSNMFTQDKKILYSVHWDSHFTLLCSDSLTVKRIVDQYQFEGFFADDQTEIYWSVND